MGWLLSPDIAKNVAHFFFQAAAISLRLTTDIFLDAFFDVPNEDLGHQLNDITISFN
ncbi:MAG TPA: hypothetical protein VN519_17335 [Bryobacteraceae bacterium]|nr:hypothetical protein [Bryobacteraceae bacterium]